MAESLRAVPNATTLHYRFNDATCEAGQLLLVDCGAEYGFYSGDITRCWPVNGKFSGVQKRVYNKILKAQKELCAMVKPGTPHFDLQQYTIRAMTEILVDEKILKGSVDENVKSGAYSKLLSARHFALAWPRHARSRRAASPRQIPPDGAGMGPND